MVTKKELKQQIKSIQREIEELKTITNVGNTEGFDLIIAKIKKEMQNNVAEEDWKTFKNNKAKIEKMRGFTEYISQQTKIIEEKEDELDDLQAQLDNYQTQLFPEEDIEPERTDYQLKGGEEIETGDVFQNTNKNGVVEFYLIKESAESEEKYAMISNAFEGELLLNYPKNREILDESDYIGNIYREEESEQYQTALQGLKIISGEDKTKAEGENQDEKSDTETV